MEAAQRTVSGVTIFDPVLHMSPLSVQQYVASSAEDAAESKPAAVAAKLPDWEREGRLWNALKVKLRVMSCAATACLWLLIMLVCAVSRSRILTRLFGRILTV